MKLDSSSKIHDQSFKLDVNQIQNGSHLVQTTSDNNFLTFIKLEGRAGFRNGRVASLN